MIFLMMSINIICSLNDDVSLVKLLQFLDQKANETDTLLEDLLSNLSAQQGQIALFANEMRKVRFMVVGTFKL